MQFEAAGFIKIYKELRIPSGVLMAVEGLYQ
jgi:hypothetical protein